MVFTRRGKFVIKTLKPSSRRAFAIQAARNVLPVPNPPRNIKPLPLAFIFGKFSTYRWHISEIFAFARSSFSKVHFCICSSGKPARRLRSICSRKALALSSAFSFSYFSTSHLHIQNGVSVLPLTSSLTCFAVLQLPQ